ncbi:hypothetical protein TRFO_25743 [Tritrichomonas foetus]|uniref:Uncharacterized protein n=1 Tax=Tritrichomonas foetus TaxID=1144522 RepID=A0A1J4K482_9EUKA|nr:hypothetical protein TRFO_25743 [Tritrichomonas foetus]|eukprot:OHT06257.1 hypothetical protein TRFO_25743 [Tritrichomonas foetus]
MEEVSFDQQASALLEQSRTRQPNTPSFQMSGINPTASVILDSIANRVSSIEERLNACDSIYRLATQANTVREKERREKFQSFVGYTQNLDQRISDIEEKVNQVPSIIKNYVKEEMKGYDNSKQTEMLIHEAQKKLTERITLIEKQYTTSLKKSQKDIKRLKIDAQLAKSQPEDDDRIDDVAAQISEMKRRQTLMFDLLNAMRSHNSQDYDNVNANLSTLWAQLSVKRPDSPRH